MIEIAGDAGQRHHTTLRSAVVNNNLVFESQGQQLLAEKATPFAGELIPYVILVRPFQPIAGQAGNTVFSLQFGMRGNIVFWQDPQDSIANSLFRAQTTTGILASPLPNALAAVDQNPNIDPPKGINSLSSAAGWLMSKAWENRHTIL